MHLTGNHALGFDLYAALCENHAIAFDLTFDLCAIAKDHGLFGDDASLHVAVNAERAGDRQRAFERYALVDKSCPLFTCAVLCSTGPLPCHIHSPKIKTLPL